ncbi:anthranilate phosphoribosyltransferase [Thalassoglobus polymorphus]|uniref:Anthranilate phosphoribosyltransferase n=1 Tax=Thalassoglobus polymorphus TaxID=2527994 RepID=A0A517QMI9_9PLAN|nr:anthranilate phosphoribosyltransferase [Thalassoglobus polymorphus]QDT32859.1 Anthranilate phosphoribosyltransferase [Thalassoglobus polymorphus]
MHKNIRVILDQLLSQQEVDANQMRTAIGSIMDGECSPVDISSLLTALAMQGETETEIAGAASAMRERSLKIQTSRTGLIDTCGTGGDKLHTFNISTATALVVAGCGQPVAKHGNRSVSSSSGSADVLETLGVNIGLTAEQAGNCLDEIGICFCYARLFHGAMKHVAPIRAELGIRTIFNLLGPLTNPASAEFQLLGANSNANAEKIAKAASQLGTSRTFVVCGNNQLDEVSLWGTTAVWEVRGDSVQKQTWTASDFGLAECSPDDLIVSSPSESADVIRGVLAGQSGSARDIVVANAAAALVCSRMADSLTDGVSKVQHAIDSGQARDLLKQLVSWTQKQATTD